MSSKLDIPQFKVYMSEESRRLTDEVLASGYIGQGDKVDQFEYELRDKLSFSHGVTVNSATSALSLALHLIGVGPGDEVVSTPMTCTATNMVIVNAGAKIVWADVDEWGNISPESVQQKISPHTKAVMAVDWAGLPCDYDTIRVAIENAPRRGYERIPIIEDAAHSILATYKSQPINKSGGDYIAYSFQAIKHLTTGDGGLLVTPKEDYERAKLLRWYGFDRTQSNAMRCRQDVSEAGFKIHMNDINAAIGLGNLPDLEWIVGEHRKNAAKYDEVFLPKGLVNRRPSNRESSYWLYPVFVENPIRFESYMDRYGIGVSQTHNRNDGMTWASQSRNIYSPLPNLDKYFDRMCCIPVGWWLTDDAIDYIIDIVLGYKEDYGF